MCTDIFWTLFHLSKIVHFCKQKYNLGRLMPTMIIREMNLWHVTGLSNCSEFHHLMMVLSHSVKTGVCFIFLFCKWGAPPPTHTHIPISFFFLFAEARATCVFCFSARVVSVLSKAECVYLRVLVKQLATFALPSAAEAEGIRWKKKKKKPTWCERWADSPGRTIAVGSKMLLDY